MHKLKGRNSQCLGVASWAFLGRSLFISPSCVEGYFCPHLTLSKLSWWQGVEIFLGRQANSIIIRQRSPEAVRWHPGSPTSHLVQAGLARADGISCFLSPLPRSTILPFYCNSTLIFPSKVISYKFTADFSIFPIPSFVFLLCSIYNTLFQLINS